VSTEKRKKANSMTPKRAKYQSQRSHRKQPQRMSRSLRTGVKAGVFFAVAVIVLGLSYFLNNANGSSATSNQTSTYPFQVGSPGPGEQAPSIKLQSTDGSIFDLSAQHGKTVLLFFQEGLSCQPCWDQSKDIESNMKQFQSLNIDTIVSITSDPLDALKQKVADEGLSTPILSDPNLAVSRKYGANKYGMMGESSDGHTFIVIGPDGRIKWRADFGGAPNYTMYVPISTLVADMKEGLNGNV
jgi:peroxiredoxin